MKKGGEKGNKNNIQKEVKRLRVKMVEIKGR